MQGMDNFISPVSGFEGDIPIPTIPISARIPNVESANDSSACPSARSSMTRAGKRKAATTLPPSKKAKKVVGKRFDGVMINDPVPKPSTTLTPTKGPRGKFTMRRSNRYA